MATVRTAKKLMLGHEIAHMIEVAGLTQVEAGKFIEAGQSRIAGLIKGDGRIAPGDLVLLANKLGFTDQEHHELLLELRRDNHKRGFWSTGYRQAYGEDLRLLIDIEKNSDLIRWSEVEIIPGLAQCEAYVRALYADLADDNTAITEDEHVQARLARQELFDQTQPPSVHFLLSESCLRRLWGSVESMREQLDYLIQFSKRPNVLLQVMPFNMPSGSRTLAGSPFTLFRIPTQGAAGPLELAYVENIGEIRYLDDKKALAAYDATWARLSAVALNFDDSRNFIRQVALDLK